MNDQQMNAAIRSAVEATLAGMVQVMAASAGEFAERVQDTVEDMREEAADARDLRQSARRLARLERLALERRAARELLAGADDHARAVIERRLEDLARKEREAAGLDALPAPEGKTNVRPHSRKLPGRLGVAAANGSHQEG